jgi:segregation and condensation protein A
VSYRIKLDQFEGPFDLLLFFIERDELDINDIPISKITEDFLAYIKQLEDLDINVASEFILVAANLMRIKAKMLLPRRELDEFGNEIDPREELAQKLLEYKKYKEVIESFADLEAKRAKLMERGNAKEELASIAQKALIHLELESLSMATLLKAFQAVMNRVEKKEDVVVHKIFDFAFDIEDQTDFILEKLASVPKLKFTELFEFMENRVHAIVTFLALLNMLNEGMLSITPGNGVNNFWIQKPKQSEEI